MLVTFYFSSQGKKNYSVSRSSVRNLFTCLSSAEGLQDNSGDPMAHGEQPL